MKPFLDDDFLLDTKTAQRLYHDVARDLPIIDYHNHLPPEQIASNYRFPNLTQAWLTGDHYKWRAMRTNGVAERYCTGDAPDKEKFEQWAATVPYTVRNPLYHWTHLELQRYFDETTLLNDASAAAIYEMGSAKLQTEAYSVRNLLRRMNVKVVCTTDDPVDTLEHHQKLKRDGFEIKVLPAFRPDKAMQVDDVVAFNAYVAKLEAASNSAISTFTDFTTALKSRHDFFATVGCCVSDHGLEQLYAANYTDAEIKSSFDKLRAGTSLTPDEKETFKSAMLYQFAVWDFEKGWVQQFHLGALRNNNTRMLRQLGADTGWDSMGDFSHAQGLACFLDRLDRENQLTKTILYNLNPRDNAVFASMVGNFNDGTTAGKIQWGSAWWFQDQKDGMTDQLNTLSNLGLVSKFVGMLTDSRSFLSFPRHEYFRRILCNLFGTEIETGQLPHDLSWMGKIISDICYHNAATYFNWHD